MYASLPNGRAFSPQGSTDADFQGHTCDRSDRYSTLKLATVQLLRTAVAKWLVILLTVPTSVVQSMRSHAQRLTAMIRVQVSQNTPTVQYSTVVRTCRIRQTVGLCERAL